MQSMSILLAIPLLQKYSEESLAVCKDSTGMFMAAFFMIVKKKQTICGDLISSYDTYVQWEIIHPFEMM